MEGRRYPIIQKPDMEAARAEASRICHVVAMPYPGRGHINPMMNLCKLLSSRRTDILITFVVTEEWFGFIGSGSKPENIRFNTLPNIIPSELGRAKDFPGFIEAVMTKLEAPFEQLLDRLEIPVTAIISDTYLPWTVDVGNRRNIPMVSFWTMPPSVLSVLTHFDLLVQNQHFPVELSERGDELVDYIPGLPSTSLKNLPTIFSGPGRQVLSRAMECISSLLKAQFLLLSSVYELDSTVIDALKMKFPFPLYAVGPCIPHFELEENPPKPTIQNGLEFNYFEWLDSQPVGSVLYISMGSFLSVSSAQMEEVVAGVRDSGVRCLWVTRGETSSFKDGFGDMGLVIPWCEQLRVLCHSSVGGFWSHCGYNSTLEAVYAGVPLLAFPLFFDQIPNSKQIVEDWKAGWRVKSSVGTEDLVTREEIAELVRKFMDKDSTEGKEVRENARKLKETCRRATAKGGSSDIDLHSFIKAISQG